MQPDGRLIQHIQHAAQPRANLRRQPDALPFAAGERRRRAVQRKIVQPHRIQKLQPLDDLALQPVRDEPLAPGEVHRPRTGQRPLQRKPVKSAIDTAEPSLFAPFVREGTQSESSPPATPAAAAGPCSAGTVVADMYCIMYSR